MFIEIIKPVMTLKVGMVKEVKPRVGKSLIASGYARQSESMKTIEDILPKPIPPVSFVKKQKKQAGTNMVRAYMATFPPRINAIQQSVKSLIDQVDELHIWCNDYTPGQLKMLRDNLDDYRIVLHDTSEINPQVNLGCLGKFVLCDWWNGYVLTVDDDFIYPPDYVDYMIRKIDQYSRKAVISLHGRVNQLPISSYYADKGVFLQCTKEVEFDTPVHIIGTGVTALHTSAFGRKPLCFNEIFTHTNISDISFSIEMQKRAIKTIVAHHEDGWLNSIPVKQSIGRGTKINDKLETNMINQFNWKLC